ncbi:hypothetical protein PHYSODRAFT_323187 [Phytophthora sojae]|uniref:Uncharacterized protein n=1 Tax=Phytophthora sojae (strain P6497) TaxID=1094619 RepID=G4YHX2_PHYSP|nr:hypothetical protein PHYSODRAFT_323187 [Phytophthora sojae]EGZ29699.1 hypothetical protein PHYSODRAFT_323187 [Phytophthora sojae]|eukprot:XP_009516974.1 hypothetical protein PHYSODRAFT_323187 [Phytophthora sojae]
MAEDDHDERHCDLQLPGPSDLVYPLGLPGNASMLDLHDHPCHRELKLYDHRELKLYDHRELKLYDHRELKLYGHRELKQHDQRDWFVSSTTYWLHDAQR